MSDDRPPARGGSWPQVSSWLDLIEARVPRFEQALCAEVDSEIFYPDKGGTTKPAKAVCGACVERDACLEWALQHGEKFGIWGGVSARDRRKLTKDRGIVPIPIRVEHDAPDSYQSPEYRALKAEQSRAGWAVRQGEDVA